MTRFTETGTFVHGIHPDEAKQLACGMPIEVLPAPAEVAIPLLQHAGSPCKPVVKAKDTVVAGQRIGDSDAFVSAPIHASVSGVVSRLGVATLPNGRHVPTVVIKPSAGQPSAQEWMDDLYGGDWPLAAIDSLDPAEILRAIREAGIVGHGGAAFPTHVKLARTADKPIDTLLVNGCECEPYLTADYRLMLEAPAPIVAGALLAARAAGARRIVLAIEDNKPAAIETLGQAPGAEAMELAILKTKYPMGGERQMIPAALDRAVPTGGFPTDIGVAVINIATAAAVARALLRNRPLTHRVVTVSGRGIAHPKNLLVPIGASYQDLADFCGGFTRDAARALAGGPMMGFALGNLHTPVTKGTSGLTVLTHRDVRASRETPCIRCGACVSVCPMNLVPTKIALSSRAEDWDTARRHHILSCCECGCCSYVCPARIPLAQIIRAGKSRLPRT